MKNLLIIVSITVLASACTSAPQHRAAVQDDSMERVTVGTVQREIYLGMSESEANNEGWRGTNEGGKLKEAGTKNWVTPNAGATNETGFNAVPSGFRSDGDASKGWFFYKGAYFITMTTTEGALDTGGNETSWVRNLYYNEPKIQRFARNKEYGYPIRCVQD